MLNPLYSLIIFCLLTILTACAPKPLLPIPKRRILFALQVAHSPFSDLNIYSINTDGTDAQRLTNNPNFKGDPSWSPDGTQIAFISFDEDGTYLYRMNADGSHPMRLTPNLATVPMGDGFAGIGNANPDWSPDGRTIIFTVYGHIKVLDLESGKVSDIVTNTPQALFPKWSPDRTKIMFVAGDGGQVYVMNADGTDQRQITKSLSFPRLLDWSPNGLWVAVYEDIHYGLLSIMQPDGKKRRILLTMDKCRPLSAAFSPDSQWLVMTCEEIKDPGIYVMNLAGGVLRKLITDLPVDYFNGIDWAP